MITRKFMYSRLLLINVTILSIFFVMSPPCMARDNGPDNNLPASNFCSKTSKAALKACSHEAIDDYWIALGNCFNLSASEDREECLFEVKSGRKETKEDCTTQYEARQEVCNALGEYPYDPEIHSDNFLDKNEIIATPNPYFPLIPGTTKIFTGGGETITVTVTDETTEILGVTCIVVRDIVEEDGEVIEDTVDWYAQDVDGNVWYFGEIALNYADGELADIEGSWKAGVDGAKAGIIMKAFPQTGDVYRQEFSLGNAEDMGEVINTTGSAAVPAAYCNSSCVVTRDWTPMEPDTIENKFYAPGVGVILEVNPETGETVELVDIIP